MWRFSVFSVNPNGRWRETVSTDRPFFIEDWDLIRKLCGRRQILFRNSRILYRGSMTKIQSTFNIRWGKPLQSARSKLEEETLSFNKLPSSGYTVYGTAMPCTAVQNDTERGRWPSSALRLLGTLRGFFDPSEGGGGWRMFFPPKKIEGENGGFSRDKNPILYYSVSYCKPRVSCYRPCWTYSPPIRFARRYCRTNVGPPYVIRENFSVISKYVEHFGITRLSERA